MEMDFFWIGLGIAIAGFFIGSGLKNFGNSEANMLGEMSDMFDDDENGLIHERDVHHFIGVTKEDAKSLLNDYPGVPHMTINGKIYYPKSQLNEWLKKDRKA